MKALFTKIETLFTRIAHKARRLISNGVLDVINIINRKKLKKNNFGTKTLAVSIQKLKIYDM